MPRTSAFTPQERGLIGGAAFLVFSRVFAFSLVLPGFKDFGATLTDSELLVGLALGAYGLTMAVAQLANGWLSDHVGRRPVLLAGSLVFVLGSAWAAVAPSIGQLLAARLLQGLGGISSVAMAAVGETVPEERRTSAMALIGVPAGLGFFLGFVFGPVGEDLVGFRGLFWATAALGLLAALPLAFRTLPPPRPMPAPVMASGRGVGLPVLALALVGFTLNLAMTAVAYYLPDLRNLTLGALLLGALVVMGVASRVVDGRRLVTSPLVAGLLLVAAGAGAFLAGAGSVALAGGLAFFAAHATLSAVVPSQVSRLAGRSGGRGHGVQLVVAYLGSAAGGALAGGLDEAGGLAGLGPAASACAALAVLAVAVAVLAAVALRGAGAGARTGTRPSTGPGRIP